MAKVFKNRSTPRYVGAVLLAGVAAACSSDVARFGGNPFSNPFHSRSTGYEPASTASISRPRAPSLAPQPVSTVSSQSIPAPSYSSRAPSLSPRNPAYTGSVGSANYPSLSPTTGSNNGWSAVGGTPVTLQQGDNINTLSGRYGVPVSAIMAVNGLSSTQQPQPGQQLIIPAYNSAYTNRAASAAPAVQKVAMIDRSSLEQPMPKPPKLPAQAQALPTAPAARKVVQQTESDAEKRAAAKLAEMRKVESSTKKAPPKKVVKADDDEEDTPTASIPDKKAADAAKAGAPKVAARSVTPPKAEPEPTKSVEAETPSTSGSNFRWPAKGRVISGFGSRGSGGPNDGINIALPEGAPIRAAEGGTVVHADDALKGYGKLVLIRHPDGYVSVYAHNSELNVKRGESVKRGQMIAKAGQSGNVTTPQLHFEIRKGAAPVDPTRYLSD